MGLRYDSAMDLPEPHRSRVLKKLAEDDKAKSCSKKHILQSTAKIKQFDSEGEAEYYYNYLRPRELAGEICHVRQQVEFELLPAFESAGIKIDAIKYTADFVYTEVATGIEYIVEVKARKKLQTKVRADGTLKRQNKSFTDSESFRLRWKLLKFKFKDDNTKRFVKWYRGTAYE